MRFLYVQIVMYGTEESGKFKILFSSQHACMMQECISISKLLRMYVYITGLLQEHYVPFTTV